MNKLHWDEKLFYKHDKELQLELNIENLTIEDSVKEWSFEDKYPFILALFGNEEEGLTKLLRSLAGLGYINKGAIYLNHENISYNAPGWERQVTYVDKDINHWNKLFSVRFNTQRYAFRNTPFLEEISSHNKTVKMKIADLKNSGLSLDAGYFKEEIVRLVKKFIEETGSTRKIFIEQYKQQINELHEHFANSKLIFNNIQDLKIALIKKFNAEEDNIIANNNLLFYQSLQDRISSLENLVGECNCGCKPPKNRTKEFQLKEISFVIKQVTNFLEKEIFEVRKVVRKTLKSCNNYNQVVNNEFKKLFTYKKTNISRNQFDALIEEWVEIAEVQRIKFNMKQDFVSIELLPDEMLLLIKNIKEEIKIYHKKLLEKPDFMEIKAYQLKMSELFSELLDVRDIFNKNMTMIYEVLGMSDITLKRYSALTTLERRIVSIVRNLVVPTRVLLLDQPFEFLVEDDKHNFAKLMLSLAERLKIIIIFSSNRTEDIKLLASKTTIIENQLVIEQGASEAISNSTLSLTWLKESNHNHLNILDGSWNHKILNLFDQDIGFFPNQETAPLVVIRPMDLIFGFKKPGISFFHKSIKINGIIKNIQRIDNHKSFLVLQTQNKINLEIIVDNSDGLVPGKKGWVTILKNTIYLFDEQTQMLIGTW